MESLDGILLIPPDRGQILGRAMWKPRYVVVGRRGAPRSQGGNPSLSQVITTSRIQASTPKSQSKSSGDEYVISIYKTKDEWEPNQQYPVSAVVDCQVQMVAHRKQGPVLPTLVVSITDKERKRRSSRAAGLISGKESSSTTLWFRTPPDDHHLSLHEWGRFIVSRKTPISPDSPVSPTFSNPFAARPRDENYPRPSSGNPNGSTLQHKSSSQTQSSRDRDRPVTYSSESPSLRSKRSDISSPSSAAHTGYFGLPIHGQNYTTVLSTELHSPVAAMSAYQSDSASSWAPQHGMPSAVSPSTNGRGSLDHGSSVVDSSSPPGPRETILDRAFQMRCIPGSEHVVPGEEKLSSLARFDALMREADEQRLRREAAERSEREATTSAWDADDSGDSDDMEGDEEYDYPQSDRRRDRDTLIPDKAQRALDFIVNRHSRPSSPGSPLAYDGDPTSNENLDPSTARPRTGHSKHRPQTSQRTASQTHLAPDCGDASSSGKPCEDGTRPNLEKRASTSSAKRRSFTEFTKRLSSTSSLLLVQSNASGGASSRGSSEYDQASPVPRSTLTPRGAPPHLRGRELEEWEKRCGWRGSVGILSAEGGFV